MRFGTRQASDDVIALFVAGLGPLGDEVLDELVGRQAAKNDGLNGCNMPICRLDNLMIRKSESRR